MITYFITKKDLKNNVSLWVWQSPTEQSSKEKHLSIGSQNSNQKV